MNEAFECPSCGAPLRPMGTPTQFCTYCESTIVVPPKQLPRRHAWPVRSARQIPRAVFSRPDTGEANKRFYIILGVFVFICLLIGLAPLIFVILAAILSIFGG